MDSHDGRTPDKTRRDIAATRREPAPTRHDSPVTPEHDRLAGGNAAYLTRLPAALADRFTIIAELSAHGAEADLVHVRDPTGGEYVVKIYRPGVRASAEVWNTLPDLDTSHIVRVLETGHSDGRDFELLEYASEGSLEGLLSSEPLPVEQVVELVRQLTDALERLHDADLVHRDLKPANILVRRRSPLEVAVTDFGLSKSLEASMVYASTSRTTAYAAPESLAGRVSPAFDWWSLGIIVRQVSTGRRPFDGLSELATLDHLATRSVDVTEVTDVRLRMLCRGLLVRDPDVRWGAPEVRDWLGGGSPPVPEERTAQAAIQPLLFQGERYTDCRALAVALARDWSIAARRFFASMGTARDPSEGWRTLRQWLTQFNDLERDDIEGRIELVDHDLTGSATQDVKLLRLLRWLNPDLPPVYRGVHVSPAELPKIAAEAEQGDPTLRLIVDDLWQYQLCAFLNEFPNGRGLAQVDRRWRELSEQWNAFLSDNAIFPPQPLQALRQANVRSALLGIAAGGDDAIQRRISAAQAVVQARPGPVGWFDRLAAEAGADPLRLVAVTYAAEPAYAEFHNAERQRRAAEAQLGARQQHWEQQEANRIAGRSHAIGRALAGVSLAYGLPCLLLLSVPSNGAGVAVVVWGLQATAESLVAWRTGAGYHPRWSLYGHLPYWLRRLPGVRVNNSGCPVGCLGILVLLLVSAFVVPFAMIAHWVWTFVRLVSFASEQRQERARILGEQP